jgi:Derlin-2/3
LLLKYYIIKNKKKMQGNSVEEWFRSLPPLTRLWFVSSFAATILVSGIGAFPGHRLLWIPEFLLPPHFHLWRLITPFVYLGGFGMPFVINLYLIVKYSAAYESNPFCTTPGAYIGGTADYAFALTFIGMVLLVVGYFMHLYLMGPILLFSVLYLWSKRNSEVPISFWGLNLKGRHLPWALMVLGMLLGNSPIPDLLGICAGHVYFFLVEVLPLKYPGRRFLNTPMLFIQFIDWLNDTNTFHRVQGRNEPTVMPPRGGGAHNWGPGRRLNE